MENSSWIELTAEYVNSQLMGEATGHDWWHIFRVWQIAKRISAEEGADNVIVELTVLLHDIADWKLNGGDEEIGPSLAQKWLESINVESGIIDSVCEIIRSMAFKGALVEDKKMSLEGQIVQDADRLDALGAIGVARTFAYGGATGRVMYDPNISPIFHKDGKSYLTNMNPSFNHFHEKLLLLKDRMNTNYGKKMAEYRHKYLEDFMKEFLQEWDGIV